MATPYLVVQILSSQFLYHKRERSAAAAWWAFIAIPKSDELLPVSFWKSDSTKERERA